MEPRFLTVAEAARYLRLNPRSVYLLAQRGGIPASRVTGKWLFPVHLLDEWVESARGGGSRDAPAAPGAALPSGSPGSGRRAMTRRSPSCRTRSGTRRAIRCSSSPRSGASAGWLAWARAGPTRPPAPTSRPGPGSPTSPTCPAPSRVGPAVVVNVFSRELGLVVWTGNPRKLEGVGDLPAAVSAS